MTRNNELIESPPAARSDARAPSSIPGATLYLCSIYLCTFAIPVALLTCVYTRIGWRLWRSRTPGNEHADRDLTMHTKRIKVGK